MKVKNSATLPNVKYNSILNTPKLKGGPTNPQALQGHHVIKRLINKEAKFVCSLFLYILWLLQHP